MHRDIDIRSPAAPSAEPSTEIGSPACAQTGASDIAAPAAEPNHRILSGLSRVRVVASHVPRPKVKVSVPNAVFGDIRREIKWLMQLSTTTTSMIKRRQIV